MSLAMESITGMVRSAFAKPPAPVVSVLSGYTLVVCSHPLLWLPNGLL